MDLVGRKPLESFGVDGRIVIDYLLDCSGL